MKKNKVLCIVCARAGSKRLKNKNFKNLFGKPLIYHTFSYTVLGLGELYYGLWNAY